MVDSIRTLVDVPPKGAIELNGCSLRWDLAHRKIVRQLEGHEQAVRGIAVPGSTGDVCVTCSDDCTARLWRLPDMEEAINFGGSLKPSAVFQVWSGAG